MSAMKELFYEAQQIFPKVDQAARLSTARERLTALTAAFQECGERADGFEAAARLLARAVACRYRSQRAMVKKGELINA